MLPNPQFSRDLVTLIEENLNGKLHFLCNEKHYDWPHWRRSGVSIVNFEHISHLLLVMLLLTMTK